MARQVTSFNSSMVQLKCGWIFNHNGSLLFQFLYGTIKI